MRIPIAAGSFYEGDKEKLVAQIKQCFLKGPGMPEKKKNTKLIGVISPHAGYAFSGICQAFSYKEIAESDFPDAYVILGFSHSGIGNNSTILDSWDTPLGTVECHKQLADELINSNVLENDPEAFAGEHSIEVQLPFLQFVSKKENGRLRIVPISISFNSDCEKLAKEIVSAIKKLNLNVIFIASSDLTHYGHNYGYVPFKTNVKENIYRLDNDAIECITDLDGKKFMQHVKKTHATICGQMPIAVMISISKLLNAKKGDLLKYYTSGDVVKDYSNAVGYASIRIKQESY